MSNDSFENMTLKNQLTWEKACDTLASMVLCQKLRSGDEVSPRTFIANLRLYANEMEKLLPKPEGG